MNIVNTVLKGAGMPLPDDPIMDEYCPEGQITKGYEQIMAGVEQISSGLYLCRPQTLEAMNDINQLANMVRAITEELEKAQSSYIEIKEVCNG